MKRRAKSFAPRPSLGAGVLDDEARCSKCGKIVPGIPHVLAGKVKIRCRACFGVKDDDHGMPASKVEGDVGKGDLSSGDFSIRGHRPDRIVTEGARARELAINRRLERISARFHKLTPREEQVAVLCLQGLDNQTIAEQLGVKPYLVTRYLARIRAQDFALPDPEPRLDLTGQRFLELRERGLSYQQIADLMGCKKWMVASRVRRAKEKGKIS